MEGIQGITKNRWTDQPTNNHAGKKLSMISEKCYDINQNKPVDTDLPVVALKKSF